jgi:hypothetical protein
LESVTNKFLKRVFESKFCRFLFGRVLHTPT